MFGIRCSSTVVQSRGDIYTTFFTVKRYVPIHNDINQVYSNVLLTLAYCAINLQLSLYLKDHHKHHISGNCNYGKRLVLWDKLFGTFKGDLSRNKRR